MRGRAMVARRHWAAARVLFLGKETFNPCRRQLFSALSSVRVTNPGPMAYVVDLDPVTAWHRFVGADPASTLRKPTRRS
jgi:hypothetical protein